MPAASCDTLRQNAEGERCAHKRQVHTHKGSVEIPSTSIQEVVSAAMPLMPSCDAELPTCLRRRARNRLVCRSQATWATTSSRCQVSLVQHCEC